MQAANQNQVQHPPCYKQPFTWVMALGGLITSLIQEPEAALGGVLGALFLRLVAGRINNPPGCCVEPNPIERSTQVFTAGGGIAGATIFGVAGAGAWTGFMVGSACGIVGKIASNHANQNRQYQQVETAAQRRVREAQEALGQLNNQRRPSAPPASHASRLRNNTFPLQEKGAPPNSWSYRAHKASRSTEGWQR